MTWRCRRTSSGTRQQTAVLYGDQSKEGPYGANTVRWDGARTEEKEPAIILLTGMGPVKTVQVDENGKPLTPRRRGNE